MAFFRQRPLLAIFLAVFMVGLTWSLYTQHAWEDYYITYRASKNLATGHGLTFTAGEQRVHSFTSPLGVLLPALSSLLTLNRSDDAALWIFRMMSLAAYAGAAVFLWKFARATHRNGWAAWLLVGLFAIDTKIVDFTTNGMETGVLMLFLSWTLYATLTAPPRQSLQIGIAWAGLMWSRPDSFIYIGAISLGALLFAPPLSTTRGRWGLFQTFLVAGVITTLLYLPWMIWAWSYYGTPVPHTITAKGLFHTPLTPDGLWTSVWSFPRAVTSHIEMLAATFMPPYSGNTGWPTVIAKITYWTALGCMVVWLIPGIRRETRLASFAFCVGEFYICCFVFFPVPWYIPTLTVFALVVLAGLVGQLVDFIRARQEINPRLPFSQKSAWVAAWIVSGFLLLGSLTITLLAAHQLRIQQALIERGERQVIGLWLRDHASSPRDTVFLECLGYIGFYSNLKMYDFPGMSSPEMVAARKRVTGRNYPDCWHELILYLSPNWLVLRPYEAAAVRRNSPELLTKRYSLARVFDVTKQVDALPFIMGRGYLINDAYFEVYHRNGAATENGPDFGPSIQITTKDMLRNKSWSGRAYDSEANIVANAPSALTVRKPIGARWLRGGFGIFPGAYEHPRDSTDGADFAVYLSAGPKSPRRELFHRFLNPREVAADRGLQSFSIELPATSGGLVEFVITPGPKGNDAYDWSYWSAPMFVFARGE